MTSRKWLLIASCLIGICAVAIWIWEITTPNVETRFLQFSRLSQVLGEGWPEKFEPEKWRIKIVNGGDNIRARLEHRAKMYADLKTKLIGMNYKNAFVLLGQPDGIAHGYGKALRAVEGNPYSVNVDEVFKENTGQTIVFGYLMSGCSFQVHFDNEIVTKAYKLMPVRE